MALKATIYKIHLHIADMDRNYYGDHHLTIARHPSETALRLMVRIIAFSRFASEGLEFTRGLCADDEPELWEKDETDRITHWIEVGIPDPDRVRKGCNRSSRMTVVAYGDRAAAVWREKNLKKFQRFENLQIFCVEEETIEPFVQAMERSMDFQISIQDGELWVTTKNQSGAITFQQWK